MEPIKISDFYMIALFNTVIMLICSEAESYEGNSFLQEGLMFSTVFWLLRGRHLFVGLGDVLFKPTKRSYGTKHKRTFIFLPMIRPDGTKPIRRFINCFVGCV